MIQKTPSEVKAGLERRVAQAVEHLDVARTMTRARPQDQRAAINLRRAHESLDRAKSMLADHLVKFPNS